MIVDNIFVPRISQKSTQIYLSIILKSQMLLLKISHPVPFWLELLAFVLVDKTPSIYAINFLVCSCKLSFSKSLPIEKAMHSLT